MNSHPMIFNADMIRAILEGKKTVTRRPLNPQPISSLEGYMWWPKGTLKEKPFSTPKSMVAIGINSLAIYAH